MERALMRLQHEHAAQLSRAATALEAEAEARGLLQFAEERRLAEADAARRQIATLRRELQALARLQQPAKAAPETVAVPAALAALPASRMREELLSQHSLLSELGVALEASEARVRQLERLHGLAQLAEEIRGSAEEAQEAVEGAHE